MKKLRTIMKYIFVIVSAIGFIFIYGTAGASDLNNIPMEQVVTQSATGLALFVAGFIGYQIIKEIEWRSES